MLRDRDRISVVRWGRLLMLALVGFDRWCLVDRSLGRGSWLRGKFPRVVYGLFVVDRLRCCSREVGLKSAGNIVFFFAFSYVRAELVDIDSIVSQLLTAGNS